MGPLVSGRLFAGWRCGSDSLRGTPRPACHPAPSPSLSPSRARLRGAAGRLPNPFGGEGGDSGNWVEQTLAWASYLALCGEGDRGIFRNPPRNPCSEGALLMSRICHE